MFRAGFPGLPSTLLTHHYTKSTHCVPHAYALTID